MAQIPLIPADVMALAERPPPQRYDRYMLMWWTPQGGWKLDGDWNNSPEEATARVERTTTLYPNRRHFRIVKISGEWNQ